MFRDNLSIESPAAKAWSSVLLCVMPWYFANCKSMFKSIYHVIWLYDWLGWVEVWCELSMCDLLDVDVELCGVLLTYVEIMRFQVSPKRVLLKPWSRILWPLDHLDGTFWLLGFEK